ncbi:hypothetical protein [Mycolicibacterium sp.]|uniref:hypothetical protein n=1 Tax=Mycolicibacterium sp. TaxID=2320850 RepID=UPI003D0E4B54
MFSWSVRADRGPSIVDALQPAAVIRAAAPRPADSLPRVPETPDAVPGVLADFDGGPPWWVPPAQLVAPDELTFGFDYRVAGHDPTGQPTIAAKVVLTVRFPQSAPGSPTATPVAWTSVGARLAVPVTDTVTGAESVVEFPVTVAEDGDLLRCTVEITGAVVRAAYGVLSTPGFQGDRTAELVIDTTFSAGQTATIPERHERRWVPDPPREWDAPPPPPGDPGGHWEWEYHSAITYTSTVSIEVEHRVPVFVPCQDHPTLYREQQADGNAMPIGCREALRLGNVDGRRFAPATQYDLEHRYTVWQSLHRSGMYLVVPMHYRVSRRAGGGPALEWLQVFDSNGDSAEPCLLQAQCVPDLTPVELALLSRRIKDDIAVTPTLLLPTSPAAGSTGVTVSASTLGHPVQAVIDNDTVRLALRVDYPDAVVMSVLIKEGDATIALGFDTGDDQLALGATAHLGVGELAGPYPAGPVTIADGKIRNAADTAARVTALWTPDGDGDWTSTALDPPLLVGAARTVDLPSGASAAQLLQAELAAPDATVIRTRSVFLENLRTTVIVRNDIDFTALALTAVRLIFSIGDVEVARAEILGSVFIREVLLTQPLGAVASAQQRFVTVAPEVLGTEGGSHFLDPTVVDLTQGAIVRLSDLVVAVG